MLFTNLHSTSPTIENNLIINKLTCGLCPSTDRIQDDEGDTSKSCWVLLVFNPFALSPSIRRYKLIHNLFEKFLMKFSIPHLWAEKRVKNIDFTSPSQHNMRKCFRLVAFDSQATAQLDCSVNFWINDLVSWKISHLLDFFFSRSLKSRQWKHQERGKSFAILTYINCSIVRIRFDQLKRNVKVIETSKSYSVLSSNVR